MNAPRESTYSDSGADETELGPTGMEPPLDRSASSERSTSG